MAGLRALFEYGAGVGGTVNYDILNVYNTNTTTAENGGSCCLWTVPEGVSWFAVEIWGGGGGGSGACCCMGGWPGGAGSYSRKFITGLSGDGGESYTICAAGTTNCSTCKCWGCAGYPSFVSINGGAVQACASGGVCGGACCWFMIGDGCGGRQNCQCGSWCGGMGICGSAGAAKGNTFCSSQSWQIMPSAPFTPTGGRVTKNGCSGSASGCAGCDYGGYAAFPGGGGATAGTHNNTLACGAAGAGGLVMIYYPVVS